MSADYMYLLHDRHPQSQFFLHAMSDIAMLHVAIFKSPNLVWIFERIHGSNILEHGTCNIAMSDPTPPDRTNPNTL
jgi:hypothetical protein